MMKPVIFSYLLMTAFFNFPVLAEQAASAGLSKLLATTEAPVPIKRVNPDYPTSAAMQSRTGWARFSFVIEKDGSVSNIVTLDATGRDFEKASIKAIKQWRYKPALENGEPIQRCVNTVQMDFKMASNAEDGVRRRFKKKYVLALQALDNNDLPRVLKLVEDMKSFDYFYAAESNALNLVQANYYKVLGNKARQLKHLSEINVDYGERQEVPYKHALINQQLLLAVELNKLHKALAYLSQLKQLAIDDKKQAAYLSLESNIVAAAEGPKNIVVKGEISHQAYWTHTPVRQQFSIQNIAGTLNKMDVRCANKYHTFTINEQSTWQIPVQWQGCSLILYGENNTTFEVVELADKA